MFPLKRGNQGRIGHSEYMWEWSLQIISLAYWNLSSCSKGNLWITLRQKLIIFSWTKRSIHKKELLWKVLGNLFHLWNFVFHRILEGSFSFSWFQDYQTWVFCFFFYYGAFPVFLSNHTSDSLLRVFSCQSTHIIWWLLVKCSRPFCHL